MRVAGREKAGFPPPKALVLRGHRRFVANTMHPLL